MIKSKAISEQFMRKFAQEIACINILILNHPTEVDQILLASLAKSKEQLIVIHNFAEVTTKEELDKRISYDIEGVFCAKKVTDNSSEIKNRFDVYEQYNEGTNVVHLPLVRGGSLVSHVNETTFACVKNLIANNSVSRKLEKNGPIDDFIQYVDQKFGNFVTTTSMDKESMCKFSVKFDQINEMLYGEPNNTEWEINENKEILGSGKESNSNLGDTYSQLYFKL